jgi:hypothetical protein
VIHLLNNIVQVSPDAFLVDLVFTHQLFRRLNLSIYGEDGLKVEATPSHSRSISIRYQPTIVQVYIEIISNLMNRFSDESPIDQSNSQ